MKFHRTRNQGKCKIHCYSLLKHARETGTARWGKCYYSLRVLSYCILSFWLVEASGPKNWSKIKFTSNKGVRLDAEVSGQCLLLELKIAQYNSHSGSAMPHLATIAWFFRERVWRASNTRGAFGENFSSYQSRQPIYWLGKVPTSQDCSSRTIP